MAQPVYVIGSQFMAPYPFDLIVDLNSGGNLVITDMNYKVLLKVKSRNTTFHHGRMLLHADGTPIVRLREKMRKMKKSKKAKFDKGKFVVTISPNVDYAFVITLIAIVDAMKNIDKKNDEEIYKATNQVIGALATS
ncbi:LURP1-like domain-containing protein [Tanacetum coccineum]